MLKEVNKETGGIGELVAGGTLYADLPIGSWVKNDMTPMPTGFLKEGDTISQTECPELYAKYGSTVPYKADKSELSDYETITISTSSSSPTVMTYDGYLTIFATGGPRTIYINGVRVANSSPTGDLDSATTVAVKKGDQVYFSNWYNNCCRGAFYKKSLIVKAKNVGVPANFSDAIQRAINTALQEYPKRYVVDGYILNGNVIRGYGRATVLLYANGRATIDYACKVTTANTASNVFGFGISPKILHQNNSNIPLITPAAGGTIMYYRTGDASGVLYPQQDLVDYCGTHATVDYQGDNYWTLARLYQTGTEPGAWPTSQMPLNTYIQGTCYGTFAV